MRIERLAFSLLLMFLATACELRRTPNEYLIPAGYVGWVRVEYDVATAPILAVENGHRILRIPADGILQTSTKPEFGWGTDEYFYYDGPDRTVLKSTGWGKGGMIWGEVTGATATSSESKQPFEELFVGTEDEFKRYGGARDDNGHVRIGNLGPPAPR